MRYGLTIDQVRAGLRTRADLLTAGMGVRDIERAVAGGDMHRVRRNHYFDGQEWAQLWRESRHAAEVLSAIAEMRGGAGVVSHASAAVIHGLPLFQHRQDAVEVTIAAALASATAGGVRRHRDRIAREDIALVQNVRCTSLERTVFDVMRTTSPETAIACADAALRSVAATSGRQEDAATAEDWRARMRLRARAATGARGIRQARQLIELANGGADRPGESVTRLRLSRLGFPRARCQVPIDAPNGGSFWVDLAVDATKTFIEFDGEGKYLDPARRAGIPLETVLLREKQREDWIRGVTGWRLVRVSSEHIASDGALAARLAAFGVHPPRV